MTFVALLLLNAAMAGLVAFLLRRQGLLGFAKGGTWQNRWPTHVDVYESEWSRFKAS